MLDKKLTDAWAVLCKAHADLDDILERGIIYQQDLTVRVSHRRMRELRRDLYRAGEDARQWVAEQMSGLC